MCREVLVYVGDLFGYGPFTHTLLYLCSTIARPDPSPEGCPLSDAVLSPLIIVTLNTVNAVLLSALAHYPCDFFNSLFSIMPPSLRSAVLGKVSSAQPLYSPLLTIIKVHFRASYRPPPPLPPASRGHCSAHFQLFPS